MAAAQELDAVPLLEAAPPLRGFCHSCAQEIVPLEIDPECFECSLCHEQCVECPYDSFEHWQGNWFVRLEDGRTSQFAIDDRGAVTLVDNAAAQLRWAPMEHEGFLMRMDGVTFDNAGLRVHIGREAPHAASLLVRHEHQDATVVTGRAERFVRTPAADIAVAEHPHALVRDPRGSHYCDLCRVTGTMYRCSQGCDFDVCATCVEAGTNAPTLDLAAAGAEARGGNSGTRRRRRLRDQLHHLLPLLQAARGADRTPGAPLALDISGLMELLAVGPGEFGLPLFDAGEQGERPAVSEADLVPWLDAHSLDGCADKKRLDDDWQCAICFDSSLQDLICVCQDSDGKALHVYHRECIADWLPRRNECPSCRKTPLVTDNE